MMRNGRVSQRRPLVPLIDVTGSSWLPTPTQSVGGYNQSNGKNAAIRSPSLGLAVVLWPTPTEHGNYNRKGSSPTSVDGLATAAGGALNPRWVEWLMGFPDGWTDLER